MISCSTFEAWCACTGVWDPTCLSVWSGSGCSSARGGVSSSVSIEPGSVKVHGNWDIVHTPRSIGRIVLRIVGLCLVRLVLITRGTIVILESSSLIVIIALEVSKRSSSESTMRDEGGSITLPGLVGLGVLSENTL